MSPDKDQEYFCDGLAEELINALSQIKGLRVVARTSAFSFKGEKIDVRDMIQLVAEAMGEQLQTPESQVQTSKVEPQTTAVP
jgi:TolB-like protein